MTQVPVAGSDWKAILNLARQKRGDSVFVLPVTRYQGTGPLSLQHIQPHVTYMPHGIRDKSFLQYLLYLDGTRWQLRN